MRFRDDRPTRATRALTRSPVHAGAGEGAAEGPTAAGTRSGAATRPDPGTGWRAATAGGRSGSPLVLDRYRLARRLGSGAFGTVWLARDERLERDVAVKILDRARVGGRFEREARVAARLSHPAIVTLYEAAVDDDGAYLVSELVRGRTLDRMLAAGRLSDREIVAIAVALCDALEHAHAQHVVHRDVKPSNVLIPEPLLPAGPPAKLTDFGIASVAGAESLTVTGDVVGTLAYMAPEQAAGLDAGPSADLYSLAVVVYEALTGVNPLAGAAAQRSRRLGIRLVPLHRQRRDLPRELCHALDRALRPHPGERGSLTALRGALAAAADLVGDEPGVSDGPWRLPFTRSRRTAPSPAAPGAWTPSGTWPAGRGPDPGPAGDLGGPAALAGRGWLDPAPAPEARREAASPGAQEALPPPLEWPPRALAAVAAAATAAWVGSALLPSPPVPVPAMGLLAAVATLLLPRVGWGAVTAGLCLAAVLEGRSGAAPAIAAALLVAVALAPARPAIWPLAAGAPALGLLGIAGLAGVWPALAARAGSAWRRAVLGCAGWLWLLLAGLMSGRQLYLPRLPGAPAADIWTGSLAQFVDRLAPAIVRSGSLAPALVWAGAAAILPWLVRGRWPALDVVRAVVWAALLVSATGVALQAAHASAPVGPAPGAAVGGVAAAAVALAPLGARRWRQALQSGGTAARLP